MLERKEELEEEKGREGKGILELEERERVTDEISMAFWLKEGLGVLLEGRGRWMIRIKEGAVGEFLNG